MVWTAEDLDIAAVPASEAVLAGAGGGAGWEPALAPAGGAAGPADEQRAAGDPAGSSAGSGAASSGRAAKPKRSARAARRRDPWRTAFFGVLALAIIGGAAWALLGSSLLVVKHEEVTGNRLLTAAKVLVAAGIRPGTPIASVDTTAAAERVEQIAQVRTARVTRSFPDTVVITIHERTPALAVRGTGGYALIDGSGITVRWSVRKPAGMPVLSLPPARLRGDPGVRAAVAVLRRLPGHLRKLVLAVSAPAPTAVTLTLRGGVTVLWGSAAADALKAAEVSVLLRGHARYLDVSDPGTAVTHS